MFGGLAFLINGNIAVSATGQSGLSLRVDPAETEALVAESGASRFEMRGRAMDGGYASILRWYIATNGSRDVSSTALTTPARCPQVTALVYFPRMRCHVLASWRRGARSAGRPT